MVSKGIWGSCSFRLVGGHGSLLSTAFPSSLEDVETSETDGDNANDDEDGDRALVIGGPVALGNGAESVAGKERSADGGHFVESRADGVSKSSAGPDPSKCD